MRNSCSMMLRGAASVNFVVRTFENRQPTDRGSLGRDRKAYRNQVAAPSVFNVLRVGFNGRTCEHNAKADRS